MATWPPVKPVSLPIHEQLYIRSLRFLSQMHKCDNVIVNTCIQEAKTNSNTPLGLHSLDNKLMVVRNLCTLIDAESGNYCTQLLCCKYFSV